MQEPQPQVTLPDDAGYQLDTTYGSYGAWYKTPEGEEMFEGTMVGGESYFAWVGLRITNYPQLAAFARRAQTTEYNRFGMDPEVTVNGATLVDKSMWNDEYMYVCVEVPIEHVAGDTVRENEKKPLCLVDGSHDEVVYCTKCGAEMSRTTVVDPMIGHDWGEWSQTKAPTTEAEGEESRICKNDASHIETRAVAKLVPAVEPETDETESETETETESETEKKNVPPTETETTAPNTPSNVPATGDNTQAGTWMIIMLGALLVGGTEVAYKRKRR